MSCDACKRGKEKLFQVVFLGQVFPGCRPQAERSLLSGAQPPLSSRAGIVSLPISSHTETLRFCRNEDLDAFPPPPKKFTLMKN